MKILKQKYHGLPGLGINGKTGKKGQNAQSIFFGYINDFFDGQKIDIKTYIYVAKRTFNHPNSSDPKLDSSTLAAAWKVTQQELGVFKNNTLQTAVNNSSLKNNNSYIDHKIFYYTGTRLTDSSIANGVGVSNSSILDNDTIDVAKQVELDLTGDYISMSFMLNSLEPNFNKSYKNYKTEYDASLARFGSKEFSNKPIYEMYNLENRQTYYSFVNGDILMNFADTNNNWHMFMPFDTNDAVYYKSPNEAGPNLESGELLNNQSYSKYYTNYPEGTSTNYVRDDNMVFSVSETGQDESYFALDTNISKAILSNSSLWTIYDNEKNNFLITTSEINNVISSSINSDFENQWNAIYKTSFENAIYEINTDENPKWYEEHDLLDSNNNARYGIASPYLYKFKGSNDVVINDSSIPSAADQTYRESLRNANYYGEALISASDGLHVYYSLDDNDTILFVPSTLKDIYNVGDVLYFYTNAFDFNSPSSSNYRNILYMVILTEDLLRCTPVQLMSAAQLASPLTIKYFSTNKDNKNKSRLCNNQNIAVLLNPCLNENDNFVNKSFINVANNYTESPVLLAGKNNSKLNNLIAVPIINGSTYSINSSIENNNLNINCSTYIKVNQLCANTNKLSENTNIELFNHIYDKNIKFYSDSFIKPLTDIDLYTDGESVDDVNYLPYVFSYTISGEDYFYDIKNLDNYFYGCDIYNKDMELIQTITSSNEKLVINLIPSPDSDIYYFQIFASYNSGIKYYSKISQLDLNYIVENVFLETKQIAIPKRTYYTMQIGVFSVESSNSYAPTLINKESSNSYNHEFTGRYVGKAPVYVRKPNIKKTTKTVTYAKDTIEYKNEDIFVKKHRIVKHSLHILGLDQQIIKEKKSGNIFFDLSKVSVEEISDVSLFVYPTDSSIVIDEILFNHNNINNDNNWNNGWIKIKYDKDITNSSAFNIDLSSNLPDFIEGENKIQSSSTINDYIKTGYSKDSKYTESPLFALLNSSSYIIPESKQRSVLVTAKYHYINVPNEYYYENFNIVQPGFKDSRGVPEIKLHAHTAMQDLQAYNSIENGVLSNQFVTYLDIDIKDFKKQWAQFSNDASISLDISIFNIDYDLNWQYKYVVENLTERRTFRMILEPAPENSSITQLNNYVKISTSMFETDKNLITLNTTKCCSTNGNLNCGGEFTIDNYFTLHNTPNIIGGKKRVEPYAGEYILCDSSFININKHSNIMYSGLQDNITINLSNIPICDDIDTIKLKILIEMGNPMLSNLYFRFAVNHIGIKVQIPGQDPLVFETNALNDYSKVSTTYLANSSTDNDGSKTIKQLNYRFISEPIDITFNPLSYTICPNDVESSYTNIYSDGVYKYGINNQIQKELKFFNASIYENNPYNYTSGKIKENGLYPFTNLYIKKSYIQDNIKQINIKPISLYDSIYKANIDNIDTSIDNRLLSHNVLDFIEGNKYLSIVYHSTIMQPKIRNDVYNFYYNDDLYLRSKYNQKLNNMPIFAYDEQSIELRDDILINSMDKWNDYYAESIKYDIANTYQGVLSLYGNGYTQILESDVKDASFFKDNISKDQILSLNDVKELNDVSINLYTGVNEVDIEPKKTDQPNNGEYFRGFLYDINWEFPYYDNTNIIPYRIVSPFDNFLNNTSTNIPDIYQEYYNSLIDTTDSSYGTNMVPYNLLFDLNPRIAYNYENDGINVLMLRRPSIGTDTDNINNSVEFKEKYEFSHQLFDLTDSIEKLKSPYTVK